MSQIHTVPMAFHEGEQKMHSLLHVPTQYNPTSPGLSPHAARLLQISSLISLGTLDDEGRPWTTLLGGHPGFARSLGQSIIGLKTQVDPKHDPVIELLVGANLDMGPQRVGHNGRQMSALGIHLATRDRVKLAGRLVAGALVDTMLKVDGADVSTTEIQAAFKVQKSLGNCPKYLNKKQIIPSVPQSVLSSDSLPLSEPALDLLARADMFFISASNHGSSMSTNHRGGPPGFVRVLQNDEGGLVLVYPEYSGNRLYQTLGNMYTDPKAGLVFPNFDSGDVLYVTGNTEIVLGRDAAAILPRSNLVIKVKVNAARFVLRGLAFRGEPGERSPYNPPIRYLFSERALPDAQAINNRVVYAKLLARDMITPTIARLRFNVSDAEAARRWKPGQYVALDFDNELSSGYSHMREDDPRSLNDDYVRTFTISSSPRKLPDNEFEITIRRVGTVTGFLFKQNIRASLEVPLKGFGGGFVIQQGANDIVPFIAGGVGITPLLSQLPDLDLSRVRLFWTLNVHDIDLVEDSLERCPSLAPVTQIFVSRLNERPTIESIAPVERLERKGAKVITRRMTDSDIVGHRSLSSVWYLCTNTSLRKSLLEWLPGKTTVYEDFDY